MNFPEELVVNRSVDLLKEQIQKHRQSERSGSKDAAVKKYRQEISAGICM